ncbi:MAG TPA: SDR family oxidoreductase [Hyphomicrobiaceae bacterium]|nr:SDR family oxidoreductase [Hyphomicrobiaceae bacterium]
MQTVVETPGTALVTGAAQRIGRAIALDLARSGWRVAVHFGASQDQANETVTEIRRSGGTAEAIAADLADATAATKLVAEAARRLGPVTCLVNNASVFLDDRIETLEPGLWDKQLDVNLRAPVLLAQQFARALPSGVRGNIVNIIDQRVLRPTPEYFSYAVSKAGLWAATRMMAQAFAPRIRVNGIGPGPVLKNVFQSDADFAAEAGSTLLGHGTSPEEIAAAVRFLLDQPAITGQLIVIDAGQHLRWEDPGR